MKKFALADQRFLTWLLIMEMVIGSTWSLAAAGTDEQKLFPLLKGSGNLGVIVPADRSTNLLYAAREPIEAFWTPDPEVVKKLESKLRSALIAGSNDPSVIDDYSRNDTRRSDFLRRELGKILTHFEGYRRQYVGIVIGGSKRVLINAFPSVIPGEYDMHDYWRQKWVFVNDGGFWYWRIQYDVQTERFLDFSSNGYA